MKNTFKIGEMSKLFQTDVRTLRYYDSINLFKPKIVDSKTGYRYYSVEQFEQLNTILYLKSLNMPLKNIRLFLNNRDIDKILSLLMRQKQETDSIIQKYVQIREKISNRISQISDASDNRKLNEIRILELKKREIVMLRQKIHKGDDLGIPLIQLENNTNMISAVFLGKMGLSISRDNIISESFDEYDSIFLIVENEKTPLKSKSFLAKGTYLSIRFKGTHKDAPQYYKKLLDYIKLNGYKILSDSIEMALIDYGLTNEKEKFVTEIQIPVK